MADLLRKCFRRPAVNRLSTLAKRAESIPNSRELWVFSDILHVMMNLGIGQFNARLYIIVLHFTILFCNSQFPFLSNAFMSTPSPLASTNSFCARCARARHWNYKSKLRCASEGAACEMLSLEPPNESVKLVIRASCQWFGKPRECSSNHRFDFLTTDLPSVLKYQFHSSSAPSLNQFPFHPQSREFLQLGK